MRTMPPGRDLPASFSDEPTADTGRLAALFDDDSLPSNAGDVDFKLDFSQERVSVPKPQPRRLSLGCNETPAMSSLICGDIEIDFEEFGKYQCKIYVVASKELRFDRLNGEPSLRVDFGDISQLNVVHGHSICISVHGAPFCTFYGFSELCAKIYAAMSCQFALEPLVFSVGTSVEAIEMQSKFLYNQYTFHMVNHQVVPVPDFTVRNTKTQMTAEKLQDRFFSHFMGMRKGARFIIGIDGTGTCFELKRLKSPSDSHRIVRTPSPSSTVGGVSTTTQEFPKPPTRRFYDDPPEETDTTTPAEMSAVPAETVPVPVEHEPPQVAVVEKPVPAERRKSGASVVDENATSQQIDESTSSPSPTLLPAIVTVTEPPKAPSEWEARITALEEKVAKLEANNASTGNGNVTSFAFDLWAKIFNSNSIPANVKPEIQKIITESLHL